MNGKDLFPVVIISRFISEFLLEKIKTDKREYVHVNMGIHMSHSLSHVYLYIYLLDYKNLLLH